MRFRPLMMFGFSSIGVATVFVLRRSAGLGGVVHELEGRRTMTVGGRTADRVFRGMPMGGAAAGAR